MFDDADRKQKFYWDQPVSDHPYWVWTAIAGIALAGAAFAAAIHSQTKELTEKSSSGIWAGVWAIAVIGGTLLGITLEQAATESMGWGGVARSIALTAIAIFAPVVGAAALAARVEIPVFAQSLGRRADWPADRLTRLSGFVLVAVTLAALHVALGLVFDPRYRDFPCAALIAAILPFVILSFANGRGGSKRPFAETAAAATLAASAVYIVFNESFANWQAVWFCVALVALAITLARARAAPGRE